MPRAGSKFAYFAACSPGLEALLRDEVSSLGLDAKAVEGGVEGRVDFEGLWRLHLGSALAESVRVRLKAFRATNFAQLQAELLRLPWHAYLRTERPLEVRVTCHRSRLYHSGAVQERTVSSIEGALRRPFAAEGDGVQTVFVRIDDNVVTPSVSASGERLHKRGYRTLVKAAPLRETIAAAMVQLLEGLQPGDSVWDPFCGSGVLPLEWLRHRTGILPGSGRSFGFEAWPCHPSNDYLAFKQASVISIEQRGAPQQTILSDRDERAVASAQENARNTALLERCRFQVGDFRTVASSVPQGTALLSNPPYGIRLGSKRNAETTITSFEQLLMDRTDLRPVVIALNGKKSSLRLPWRVLATTKLGGVPLRLLGLTS